MNISNSSLDNFILVPSRMGTAIGAITAFLFIIFGILGDTLIIVAIISKRELRNNLVNVFIVSLQLNDIFNIGFNQFLVGLSYTFMRWYGPHYLCDALVYSSIICTGSLLWHHALISIHRYLVVVCNQNIRYFGMSPKLYVFTSLIVARIIPIFVCAPSLINRKMTVYIPAALRCMLAPRVSGVQNLLIVLVNMAAPCLIVIFCFARIFAKVHSVSKKIRKSINASSFKNSCGSNIFERNLIPLNKGEENMSPIQNKKMDHSSQNNNGNSLSSTLASTMTSMHREIQITKMFAIIFTVFLFGYLPYGIIRLIDKKNGLHPDVYVLLTVLFIISISISPVIYGLMNTQIRFQCIILLRHLFGCERLKAFGEEPTLTNIHQIKKLNYKIEREATTYVNEKSRKLKKKPDDKSKFNNDVKKTAISVDSPLFVNNTFKSIYEDADLQLDNKSSDDSNNKRNNSMLKNDLKDKSNLIRGSSSKKRLSINSSTKVEKSSTQKAKFQNIRNSL